ncbi:hypothetical protein [Absidia glauca]|uniref:ZSWIM1/3 RNaseH-like domain-containing protein n=1 Tax=Absidia glauca TaxID=4829 RepID=A0A168PTV6_ABSGL|nr:hypothetical protein [Absidia glauca]
MQTLIKSIHQSHRTLSLHFILLFITPTTHNTTDVYNINQRVVKSSFFGKSKDDQLMLQIDEMIKDGFVVKTNVSDDSVLRMLMITHPDAIKLTKRFGDVLAVDATYQTNNLDMSLFNLVGFTNLGGKRLKTFVVASVLMVSESTINYEWALNTFKETIWADKNENPMVQLSYNVHEPYFGANFPIQSAHLFVGRSLWICAMRIHKRQVSLV